MRKATSVEQHVAITLWCFATPAEYRMIACLFGVAQSTFSETVHEMSQAIVSALRERYICFPSNENIDAIVINQTRWGVPQCVGAVDGSHILICGPKDNHTDYYNCKRYYFVIVQGLVDHRCCFLDVYIGWPGSVHNAHVFAHSSLYTKFTKVNYCHWVKNHIMGLTFTSSY